MMNNEVIEIESIPTKIKYKGIIWVPELKKEHKINNVNKISKVSKVSKVNKINKIDKADKNFTTPTERQKQGNIKKPYIVKWIEKKESGDVFTLDQFYRKYPKLKKNVRSKKRVDKTINDMVCDGIIEQWRKDKKFKDGSFRVIK